MGRIRDMTAGSPRRHLIAFGLPITAGMAFQQLYTIADGAVVGRLIGIKALAAVGATGWLSWMAFCMVLGMTQGFSIILGQRFGAGDEAGQRKALALSGLLSIMAALLLSAAGLVFLEPLLVLARTPREVFNDAAAYVSCLLGGLAITALGQWAAASLRALGDSRTPLNAMLAASAVNIVLDVVFVALLRLGVPGVAVATLLAQAAAALLCVRALFKYPALRPRREDWRPGKAMFADLMRLGMSPALRNVITSIGGLVVQAAINGYGVLFVAGIAAARRIYGLMELPIGGLEGAVAAFAAQNRGAGHAKRIEKGVNTATWLALISSAVMGGLALLSWEALLRLFIAGQPNEMAQALEAGHGCLIAMALCLPALYMLCIRRAALQGMGYALLNTVSGAAELLMRLVSVLLLPLWLGSTGIYMADGLGWVFAAILLAAGYRAAIRRPAPVKEGRFA